MATESTDLILNIIAKDKASQQIAKTGLAIAAAATAIVEFGRKSVEAYSDAEKAESQLVTAYGKFNAIHDVTLKSLNDLADATQKKTIFDHAQVQSAEAVLATFNLTGKQIEQLIPLVADYAGRTNTDLVTASQNVGKAFVGNSRALKGIGINFKSTGDTAKDFAIIMADLNAKVGGFEAGQSGTAAFKAAQLKNEFQDLQEQVGSILVPALKTLADIITPVVEGFNSLSPPVKNTIVIVGVVGSVALVAVPKIVALKAALVELGVTGTSAATELEATAVAEGTVGRTAATSAAGVGSLVGKLGLIGGALLLVGTAFKASGLNKFSSVDVTGPGGLLADPSKLKNALDKVHFANSGGIPGGNGINDTLSSTFIQAPDSILNAFGAGITGPFDAAKKELGDLDNALAALVKGGDAKQAAVQFAAISTQAKSLGISTAELNGYFNDYLKAAAPIPGLTDTAAAAVGGFADRGSEAVLSTQALGVSINGVDPLLQTYAIQAQDAADKTLGLYDSQLNGKLSALQFQDSLWNLTDTLKHNGKTLDDHTKKGHANQEAILGLVESTVASAQSDAEKGVSLDKLGPKYQAQIKQIEQSAIKAGFTKDQVDKLIGVYGKLPPEVTTLINQKSLDDALAKARALLAIEQQLGVSKVGSGGKQGQATQGRRAAGGSVLADSSYLVGEKGPEIFTPSSSGYVMSHAQSVGGNVVHIDAIYVTNSDPNAVIREIQKYQKRNGRGWAA